MLHLMLKHYSGIFRAYPLDHLQWLYSKQIKTACHPFFLYENDDSSQNMA